MPERAMIFAAGRGERLRPLTDRTPKPLLTVAGRRLAERHLDALAAAGVREVVINTSHLAEQFAPTLGDGARWGLHIRYCHEGAEPLETGGGMLNALPWLGDDPFILVNGDVWSDVDLAALPPLGEDLAHLVLVPPAAGSGGDFALDGDRVRETGASQLTYAGIGVYRAALFADWRSTFAADDAAANAQPPRFKLAPLLIRAMRSGRIGGQRHGGRWYDIGTPERLAAAEAALAGG